ncbi:MAG: 4Fe-4S dicluster domain-containing protein [Eubacteriales bacterium]
MALMAKMIDVTKCTGCRACQVACKQWNQLPAEIEAFTGSLQTHTKCLAYVWTFVKFVERTNAGVFEWLFRKHQCMHCQDATCISTCGQGAYSRSDVGSVIRDPALCIGCGQCERECPYAAPVVKTDAAGKSARSCKFCWDRVGNSLTPACAKACTTGAIQFGDRTAMQTAAEARKTELLAQYPEANVYGIIDMHGTLVFYVLPYAPSVYGLTANQQNPKTGTYDYSGYSDPLNPKYDPNHYWHT